MPFAQDTQPCETPREKNQELANHILGSWGDDLIAQATRVDDGADYPGGKHGWDIDYA